MDRDEWEGRLLLLEPTIRRIVAVYFGLRNTPLSERNAFRTFTRRLRRVGERWPTLLLLLRSHSTERAARGGGRLGIVFYSAEEQALIRQQATTLLADAGAKSFRCCCSSSSPDAKAIIAAPSSRIIMVLVLRGVGKGRTVHWLQEWLRTHAYCHATALRGAELRRAQANTI